MNNVSLPVTLLCGMYFVEIKWFTFNFFVVFETIILLCSSGKPGTHYVEHCGVELALILPILAEYWDHRYAYHMWLRHS